MERSDILLLIATFVFGVGTGIYVYFAMYEPVFRFDFSTDQTPDVSYSIVGDQYGACETAPAGCGSFRVLSSRSYRVIFADDTGVTQQTREGLLSDSLMQEFHRELNRVYQRDGLDLYPMTPPQCRETPSGVRYTIDITDAGRYYLDSCAATVSVDDPLWRSLERITTSLQLR